MSTERRTDRKPKPTARFLSWRGLRMVTLSREKMMRQNVDTGTAVEDHDVSSQVAEQFVDTSTAVDTGTAVEDQDVSSQFAEDDDISMSDEHSPSRKRNNNREHRMKRRRRLAL